MAENVLKNFIETLDGLLETMIKLFEVTTSGYKEEVKYRNSV